MTGVSLTLCRLGLTTHYDTVPNDFVPDCPCGCRLVAMQEQLQSELAKLEVLAQKEADLEQRLQRLEELVRGCLWLSLLSKGFPCESNCFWSRLLGQHQRKSAKLFTSCMYHRTHSWKRSGCSRRHNSRLSMHSTRLRLRSLRSSGRRLGSKQLPMRRIWLHGQQRWRSSGRS